MGKQEKEGKIGMLQRLAVLYLVALAFAVWGFVVAYYQAPPYAFLDSSIREIEAFFRGGEGEKKNALDRLTLHRMEAKRAFPGDGFMLKDPDFVDPGYLLLSHFSKDVGQVIVELVRLDGFQTLHVWTPPVEEILTAGTIHDNDTNNPEGYRVMHPLLGDDGSLVFHSTNGALAKIDRDSKVEWVIPGLFHHSIEQDYQGNIVACVRNLPPIMKQASEIFADDGYIIVSPEGKLLHRESVGQILADHGYRGKVFGFGTVTADPLHVNDAQPVLVDGEESRIGDLAISIRNISTVMLYRPAERKILWVSDGPWLNQHDIDALPDGRYSIFGNDIAFFGPDQARRIYPMGEHNEIYVYDPRSGETETPYTEILSEAGVKTYTEGLCRILPDGDVFVEDSNNHRLLRLSPESVRWEYINSTGKDTTGMVSWCRYLQPEEVPASLR